MSNHTTKIKLICLGIVFLGVVHLGKQLTQPPNTETDTRPRTPSATTTHTFTHLEREGPTERSRSPEEIEASIIRQVDRHVRLKATGYYDNVLDENSSLPDAMRFRMLAEYHRLEALSEAHGEIRDRLATLAPGAAFDHEGLPSFERQRAHDTMDLYGINDQIRMHHIQAMRERANDPRASEGTRPDPQAIEAFLESGHLPYY
ncbi:MAG: hypothetical protein JJU29_14555 [Verrucomicrobia bacterium]|nr:hypothetical protein [Verrucomicrobiota bacterium]MCH8512768.1 hypothetical protein [Kiritimatiellia bacterium]